jgi:arginyl-tRNA--protein-N-Asp/Glu arginylyltransferase
MAQKKLSFNSPPEAHFHRKMRELHRSEMRLYKGFEKLSPSREMYELHRKYADMHDARYKTAMI